MTCDIFKKNQIQFSRHAFKKKPFKKKNYNITNYDDQD